MIRHVYDCHVRFSDVDLYGHVNNVKYFEYYQEARLRFLQELWGQAEGGGFTVVVARVDVDYKRPILFRTTPYVVESWITRVGRSSFVVESAIKDGDELLSVARTVLVRFDLESHSARPLAEAERAWLEARVS